MEEIRICNAMIEQLTESSTGGVGEFIIATNYDNKTVMGKIVSIQQRMRQGEVFYDVCVLKCEWKEHWWRFVSNTTREGLRQVVECTPEHTLSLRNIKELSVIEEYSSFRSSC